MEATSLPDRRPATVALRIAAAVLGGYVFCWGLIAFGVAGFYALGMAFHDAEHLSSLLAFLTYLVVFLWAFAARSLARVWLVLLVGGAVMTGLGSAIQHLLVQA